MKKQVLFFHGAGDGGYEADLKLYASLQTELGNDYEVHYPLLLPDDTIEDFAPIWLDIMVNEISSFKNEFILVGHSLGASMSLKYLSENSIEKNIAGIFLIAPPFWRGNEDWVKPFKLQKDFADKLPKDIPIFFYHCKDDDEVAFDDFLLYKQKLPWATFHEIQKGGHQLNNDLAIVAKDIRLL